MAECEVDDAVAFGRRGTQHVKIGDIAAANLGAGSYDGLGGSVGAGETEDLVIGREQLGHNGGADPAGRTGDEYAHGIPPVGVRPARRGREERTRRAGRAHVSE